MIPQSTNTIPDAEVHVYRMQAWRQVVMLFLLAFGLAILLMTIILPVSGDTPIDPAIYPWVVLGGFLFFDLCLYFTLAARNVRIVTTPTGIEYYGMGVTVRAAWSQVSGFATVRSGSSFVKSLMVTTQADMSGLMAWSLAAWPVLNPLVFVAALLTGRFYMLGQDFDADKIAQSIPIGYFADQAPGASLDADIQRYAPPAYSPTAPIMAETTAQAPATVPPTRAGAAATDRRLMAVFTVGAALLVEALLSFLLTGVAFGIAQPGLSAGMPGTLWLEDARALVTLSANGQALALTQPVGEVQVLSYPDHATLGQLPLGSNVFIESVALSSDGSLALVGDDGGTAQLWSVTPQLEPRQTFSVTQPTPIYDNIIGATTIAYVYAVALSPDNSMLAAVGPSGAIKLWRVADGSLLTTMQSSATARRLGADAQLAFTPDGKTLLGRVEGTLERWAIPSGASLGQVDPAEWIESFALDASGKTMALGTLYGGVYLWNVATNEAITTLAAPKASAPSAYGVSVSPDGQIVAAGFSKGGFKLWHADGSALASYRLNDDTVRWMAFTPDSKTMLYQKYNADSIWAWDLPATAAK